MAESDVEKLQTARSRWLGWLNDDEVHSINGQLSSLFWHDAVFRIFNEGRFLAKKHGPNSAVSPLLAQFLDQGYVGTMVLGVSKLTEWSDPKRPIKGVVSLRRLLDELMEHKDLLTRKNYLAVHSLPYDFHVAREKQLASLDSGSGVMFVRGSDEPSENWMGAELAHKQFDKLSAVSSSNRKEGDQVSERIFRRLNDALNDDVFEHIRTVRHKVVAHAADKYSRNHQDVRQGLTLNEVDKALRLLASVRQVIQASILNDSWHASDQFEHLDAPFVSKEGIEHLNKFWKSHADAREVWLTEGCDEFFQE
jgi:hypothetical protein